MSSSVCVLAPNGRRQTVKCTPNTTILQIIEEVCKKQGLKSDEYDVKHHNKILDTTSSFRFSGLPNNAQLELVAAVKARLDSEVTLAINLESGQREIGNFLPDETLWNILEKLCPDQLKIDNNLVVIYTRQEIFGEQLKSTTLKSLGLRGGRAMLRVVHRSPEELKTQANVFVPLPAKPAEEKPYHRKLITDEEPQKMDAESVESKVNPRSVQKKAETDILKLAREKRKLPDSPAKTGETSEIPKTKPKVDIKDTVEIMDVDQDRNVSNKPPSPVLPEDDFIFLGERNAMLFSLESAHAISSDDLPDDFFELTIDDAKKILKDIRTKRHGMENGTLMTAAMRNLEESKKQLRFLNKYKKSVIRVQFPDRTVLQGTFAPTETIADIIIFVREYLEDQTINFYLYTTPPKCILNEEDRLVEVGCVPGALLHLGTKNDKKEIRLRADVRDKFTTNSMASLAASKTRKHTTRDVSDDEDTNVDEVMDCVPDTNLPGPSSEPASCERKVQSTEKVPKWFKPSK